MIESLEWLRPGWLFVLPAGLALSWAWWRASAGAGPWRKLVDPELLAHLAGTRQASSARPALAIAVGALVLAGIGLAGPAWRTQASPLHRDLSARIVVLDLSPSMDAIDVAPSRLELARAAIAELLAEPAGARLGLVVFGADAFAVAPLTGDAATLIHLLGGLSTGTLPRAGSRPDLGLDMARMLLKHSGSTAGDVILVGDSAGDARTLRAARALADAGFPLSVLAVGSAHGGPVRLASDAFARTQSGEVLVARPDLAALERVAREGAGAFRLLAGDAPTPRFARGAPAWGESRGPTIGLAHVRQDDGAWFVLLALPFAALLFRRGWLACIAALAFTFTLPPTDAYAQSFDWRDLWRRTDQQAAAAFSNGRPGEAAQVLAKLDPGSPWHAMLLYRSGRFTEAAARFALDDNAVAHYNHGNALALEGRLAAALEAYDAALARAPAMGDAQFNRTLVRAELAKRRAQGRRAAEEKSGRSTAPSRRAMRQDSPSSGEDAPPGAARRDAQSSRTGGPAQPRPALAPLAQETPARPEGDALDASRLRHIEGLVTQLRDDPASLLAARFAHQLRLRGTAHQDRGARW